MTTFKLVKLGKQQMTAFKPLKLGTVSMVFYVRGEFQLKPEIIY
jgi:hypothetical protein